MSRASLVRTSLIACALAALPVLSGAGRAQTQNTFIMPDDDGYGIGECLAAGEHSSCGRIAANSWCASKGFTKAAAFGRADMSEVTGSVPTKPTKVAQAAPGLVTITCEK